MPQLEILIDIVFMCNALPVLQNLCSLGIFFGPICLGLEGRLVDIGGDVAAYSGVDVLVPCPSNIGVLIKDLQFDTGNFDWEQYSSCDSCETGSNNRDLFCCKSVIFVLVTRKFTRIFDGASIGWSSSLKVPRGLCTAASASSDTWIPFLIVFTSPSWASETGKDWTVAENFSLTNMGECTSCERAVSGEGAMLEAERRYYTIERMRQ